MKIASWNCNGKFREKYKIIKETNADIYVIQECENPEETKNEDYQVFGDNCIWIGNNRNKGLGIFASPNIIITNNDWPSYSLRNFISVKVNDSFDLLAVWAGKPYIEEYFIYHLINEKYYNDNMLVIGDFNSNKIWDKKHQHRNHSAAVELLNDIGLISAYHLKYNEEQGKETVDTFFLYRHKSKGYHIDYAFANEKSVRSFKILTDDIWLNHSDHRPIVLELY
jgi:exonuclease III